MAWIVEIMEVVLRSRTQRDSPSTGIPGTLKMHDGRAKKTTRLRWHKSWTHWSSFRLGRVENIISFLFSPAHNHDAVLIIRVWFSTHLNSEPEVSHTWHPATSQLEKCGSAPRTTATKHRPRRFAQPANILTCTAIRRQFASNPLPVLLR